MGNYILDGIILGVVNCAFLYGAYKVIYHKVLSQCMLECYKITSSIGAQGQLLKTRLDTVQNAQRNLRNDFKQFTTEYYGNTDYAQEDMPGTTIEELIEQNTWNERGSAQYG